MALTPISPIGVNNVGQSITVAKTHLLRVGSILSALVMMAMGANAANVSASSGAPANNGAVVVPRTSVEKPAKAQPSTAPQWHDLTPAQQTALAPLAPEWDKLDNARKKKWLVLGNKYASMKPDEQQRMQERMRDWVKLTPEQRRIARESYARAKKLNPDQKSEQWQRYQQLPEEQKRALAARANTKKPVATLPTAAQRRAGTVPPIKSTPKPVLEQSVTPQATNNSALKPSPSAPNK